MTADGNGDMRDEPFVLDSVDNPHPVMLMRALQFRSAARAEDRADDYVSGIFWLGYRDAMCDATGCSAENIEAWMDRHDDFDPAVIGTPVEPPRRR